MYVRKYSILEKMLPVTHIVLDKTGTITNNNQFEITYHGDTLKDKDKILLASVAAQSQHPLSKAISNWLGVPIQIISNFKEAAGLGVEAWYNDHYIKLGSNSFVWGYESPNMKGSVVAFKIDDTANGFFILKNNYRKGLKEELKWLSNHFHLSIISGDNDAESATLREWLGQKVNLLFNQSPHDKLCYIKNIKASGGYVMMVGDGLNDAAALSESHVGVAVTDNVNNFSPACDAILEASQLWNLHAYLKMTKKGRQVIYFSFIISILYNVVGLSFAGMGLLSPMIAAILMPASSISILLITWGGVRFYARRYFMNSIVRV
jgi:Cu+-exporting ATPase